MSDTVYVLGAGLNQIITSARYGVSPPLVNNFFQVALRMHRFSNDHYTEQISELYAFIKKYWKKDKQALATMPFDLEECFTLIEMQLKEKSNLPNKPKAKLLMKIRFQLRVFVAQVLSEFWADIYHSDTMLKFGQLLFRQKPMIITFNYDTFVEEVLATASGVNTNVPKGKWGDGTNEVSDEELGYSHYNWNSRLGYGIMFDEVQLARAGIRTYVNGERFFTYAQNELYDWGILKLHGSLNWFEYLPDHIYQHMINEDSDVKPRVGTIVGEHHFWDHGITLPTKNGQYINPIIVPPTLYKEEYFTENTHDDIFSLVWGHAETALSQCRKLIVIGYSFPPTDFATKKLFLEAFAGDRSRLEELILVNPDTSSVQKVKELCHFDKPTLVCRDLHEFMNIRGP
ncbi:MAG: hypothetical protein HMLIMOIP_002375 [Candidatus Nitrosomirales archaeon]